MPIIKMDPDIVNKTRAWIERIEQKTTLENLNRLLDEVNLNPIRATMWEDEQ